MRPYRETDVSLLQQLHARQGLAYPFPDLNNPKIFFAGAVADDFSAAGFLRHSAEVYLMLDPTRGNARDRWQTVLKLHQIMERQAREMGLDRITCWVAPEIRPRFCKRLTDLGWREDTCRALTFFL